MPLKEKGVCNSKRHIPKGHNHIAACHTPMKAFILYNVSYLKCHAEMSSKHRNPPVKLTIETLILSCNRCVRFDVWIGSTQALDHTLTNEPELSKAQVFITCSRYSN